MDCDTIFVPEKTRAEIAKVIQGVIPTNETIIVALKGLYKEYLIATDQRVYIIKKGFMTGHTFGSNVFSMPYHNITSVQLHFNMISGYFEISSGGVQSGQKSFWANDSETSVQKAPNTISLSKNIKSEFDKAAAIINKKITEKY